MKAQASIESLLALLSMLALSAVLLNAQQSWTEQSGRWAKESAEKVQSMACAGIADSFLNNAQSDVEWTEGQCNSPKPGIVASNNSIEETLLHESAVWKRGANHPVVDSNALEHYES